MRVTPAIGLVAFLLAGSAGAAAAQALPSYAASPYLEPSPDPAEWWTRPEPRNELVDPLGDRKPPRNTVAVKAPVDASVYRLWGLMPLQTQILRRDETVYEVWVRPVDATRQAVVRVTERTDGRVFLQARAGRGCCGPGVGRRVDIDRELDRGARDRLRGLKLDPAWAQPEHVLVQEEGSVAGICVDGTAYDLTRVEARRSVHLRRSCDPAEVGSAATVLRTLLGLAQGFDPRFDAAVKGGVGFATEQREYAALLARGGRLRTQQARSTAVEPEAPVEADSAPLAEDDPRTAVLEADRAFATRSQQAGTAQAFREFMHPDEGKLILPSGAPVVGDERIYALMGGDAPEDGKLLWEPVEAFAAESGELAVTWGRARWVPNDPEAAERKGGYVTLWRKDEADGRWLALVDIGNMPAAASPTPAAAIAAAE